MSRPYNVININGHIVPATFHDGLKKILARLDAHEVTRAARMKYRVTLREKGVPTTCLCAIGALLTEPQLDAIALANENTGTVWSLTQCFGKRNIEAMTGMKIGDARAVQASFDSRFVSSAEFRDSLLDSLDLNANYPNPATNHTGAWHWPVSGE